MSQKSSSVQKCYEATANHSFPLSINDVCLEFFAKKHVNVWNMQSLNCTINIRGANKARMQPEWDAYLHVRIILMLVQDSQIVDVLINSTCCRNEEENIQHLSLRNASVTQIFRFTLAADILTCHGWGQSITSTIPIQAKMECSLT